MFGSVDQGRTVTVGAEYLNHCSNCRGETRHRGGQCILCRQRAAVKHYWESMRGVKEKEGEKNNKSA